MSLAILLLVIQLQAIQPNLVVVEIGCPSKVKKSRLNYKT